MTMTTDESDKKTQLRTQAEARVKKHARSPPRDDDSFGMSRAEMNRLIFELHTHEVELEMQNEELRRTQQQLLESRDQYSELYDFAPVGYLTLNAKTLIGESNQMASLIFGRPKAELLNRSFSDFIHSEDQDIFYKLVMHLKESAQHASCELRVQRKSLGTPWFKVDAVPVREEARFHGVRLCMTEISERKRAEMALVAKEIAEHADRAKTQFLTAASHDLRQPLQTLSALNVVLSKIVRDTHALGIIQKQSDALRSITDLVNTLLDISKLESGIVHPEISVFPLEKIFERLRFEFALQADSKQLDFRILSCRHSVKSDAVLLGEIIQNLVANAIKYTERGKILVGCRRRGAQLRIEVWDSGPGIPPDKTDKIFEEFYQLQNPERDRNKGFGLGLTVVNQLCRLLGHRVEAYSVVGKGSRFTVTVPIVDIARGDGKNSKSIAKEVRLQGRSILIIEDDAAVRESLRLLLSLYQPNVITAVSIADACDRLQQLDSIPELIISDYRLPDMNLNVEAIRRLHRSASKTIPFIVLTGDTSPNVPNEFGSVRCHVLKKPVDIDRLIMLIQELLTPAADSPRIDG